VTVYQTALQENYVVQTLQSGAVCQSTSQASPCKTTFQKTVWRYTEKV